MISTTNAARRRQRIRLHLRSVSSRPRLSVYRSNAHITASIIDDAKHQTIATVSDIGKTGTKSEKSQVVGREIALLSLKLGVKQVAFDRGSYRYHGRVKALAESARSAGLDF